jgi:intracellular sulfur oxidation DsrE/DsrF family protein
MMEGEIMLHKTGIAWKVVLWFLLGAVVVFAAVVMSDPAWAADDNPVAGLKEAKVAFDITMGEPNRMLLVLNTIDETREGFMRQGITPRFVLAFRGPASLLTQTDLSRFKPEDRETAAKVAAKLKQLRGTAGIERMDQCSIAMRGQKVDRAQVNPDVTIVENGWITLVGYQAKGYAYIAP